MNDEYTTDYDELYDADDYDKEDDSIENGIVEQEVDVSKNDAIEIMKIYNDGVDLKSPAEAILRELYHLKKKDKLTVQMLTSKPEGISQEDFQALVNTYRQGMQLINDANGRMIEKMSMFIYYVIERKFNTFKLHTKDLYQEGCVGILKGMSSYDPKRSKPTTYFWIYIAHEMTEYINLNINKTTSHYSANIVKVKKAINHFEREGREWTVKDIAQETGISAETITQALNIMASADEVHYDTVDYLDSKISKTFDSPEETVLKNETARIIREAIATLSEDEANVILLKYGLTGEEAMSYKNISARLGIQIDKVKKLNNSGLRKLKRCKLINKEFNYLKRTENALNSGVVGVVPIKAAEEMMNELDEVFAEEEITKNAG